ncbi:MAG: SHOCT domain-containing protein [Halorubrum sp.]
MVRFPDGVRRDPEDAVAALFFAATIVFVALGWWSAAALALALGIGGAIVVDTLWPDGFEDPSHDETATATDADAESTADALDTLRDRYASGDLGDEEFERKVEALLETETLDGARRRAKHDGDVGEYDATSAGDDVDMVEQARKE